MFSNVLQTALYTENLYYTHNPFQDLSNLPWTLILKPSSRYLTIRRTIMWAVGKPSSIICLPSIRPQPGYFHLAGLEDTPQQNIFSGCIFTQQDTSIWSFGTTITFSKIYFLLNGYSVPLGIKMIKQKQILEVMWAKHNRYFKYLTLASY